MTNHDIKTTDESKDDKSNDDKSYDDDKSNDDKSNDDKSNDDKSNDDKSNDDKSKDDDENDKIFFSLGDNCITNYLSKFIYLKKIKGLIYYYLHICFIIIILFITLFTTSKINLIILLLIVSLDALSIICLHGCPLTTLEKKYLGYNSCEERDNHLKQMNISYNCNHTYEKQIEIMVNIWCIISMKCLLIISFNMFNIKLNDTACVYS